MKVGVIGYGVVGQAISEVFREADHEVVWADKETGNTIQEVCEQTDKFVFVCVPTPTDYSTETADMSIVEDVVGECVSHLWDTDKVIVIKSTVKPGTTGKLQEKYGEVPILFNPEFLTAAQAVEDFRVADRTIIGMIPVYKDVGFALGDFYKELYGTVQGIHFTYPTEAEFVKYMGNTFLAMKVIFANEIKSLCDELDVSYGIVSTLTACDKRIGFSHLEVTKDKGFGGMCFPKDIIALINKFDEAGVDASILKAVWEKNKSIRKNKDWIK